MTGISGERIMMRVSQFLLPLAAVVAVTAPAQAGIVRHYDAASFKALARQGAPVVIFVHAPWCPICRAQEKTISSELNNPAYRDLIVMKIDFDHEKKDWAQFHATRQSTLIAFRGGKEVARLAYDADPAKVKALLAATNR